MKLWAALICLICSAILSPAITGQATAQQAAAPLLTAEKLAELMDFARGAGVRTLNPVMTRGLGLADSLSAETLRIERPEGRAGLAIVLPDRTQLIFLWRTADAFHLYLADRQTRLLAAGTMVGETFTPVPVDAARLGFEAELRRWQAEPINRQ